MSDLCKGCTEELMGPGLDNDLSGLTTEEDTENGVYATAICEGCGCVISVDHTGKRIKENQMAIGFNFNNIQYLDMVRVNGLRPNAVTHSVVNPGQPGYSWKILLRWITDGRYFEEEVPENDWRSVAKSLGLNVDAPSGRVGKSRKSFLTAHRFDRSGGELLTNNMLLVAGVWISIPDRRTEIFPAEKNSASTQME